MYVVLIVLFCILDIVENSANVKLFTVLMLSLLILVIVAIRYQWKKE